MWVSASTSPAWASALEQALVIEEQRAGGLPGTYHRSRRTRHGPPRRFAEAECLAEEPPAPLQGVAWREQAGQRPVLHKGKGRGGPSLGRA